MTADATRLLAILVKNSARRFKANPGMLGAISWGLTHASPDLIISICERKMPLGRPYHLKAAILYARYQRRFERAEAV